MDVPELTIGGEDWRDVLAPPHSEALAAVLRVHLPERRWFRGKSRQIENVAVVESVPLPRADHEPEVAIAFVRVTYADHGRETYVLPLSFRRHGAPVRAAIARLRTSDQTGLLLDAGASGDVGPALLTALRTPAVDKRLHTHPLAEMEDAVGHAPLPVSAPEREQSNTTLLLGDRAIVKLYRVCTPGPNPEVELGTALTVRVRQGHPRVAPRVLGSIDVHVDNAEAASLAVVHEFVPSHGDAWTMATRQAATYLSSAHDDLVPVATNIAQLGRRTAELHAALGAPDTNPALAPTPLTFEDQRELGERIRTDLANMVTALRTKRHALDEATRVLADDVLTHAGRADAICSPLCEHAFGGLRSRTHGDYHLGQVLFTGDDFVIIDFEGEPARPLAERRAMHNPLRDVVGMVRSLDYAAAAALREVPASSALRASTWTRTLVAAFVRAHEETLMRTHPQLLPAMPSDRSALRTAYELEKVIYEVLYELDNRPTWVAIPLHGLQALLNQIR